MTSSEHHQLGLPRGGSCYKNRSYAITACCSDDEPLGQQDVWADQFLFLASASSSCVMLCWCT
jgi:hypothetical protein